MAGDRYYNEFRWSVFGGKVEVCSDDVQQALHLGVRDPMGKVQIATLTPDQVRLLAKMLGDGMKAIGEIGEAEQTALRLMGSVNAVEQMKRERDEARMELRHTREKLLWACSLAVGEYGENERDVAKVLGVDRRELPELLSEAKNVNWLCRKDGDK